MGTLLYTISVIEPVHDEILLLIAMLRNGGACEPVQMHRLTFTAHTKFSLLFVRN